MNYLDRSNLTSAYVSGMKVDLGFTGNQLTVINTVFTVGYVMYYSPIIPTLSLLTPTLPAISHHPIEDPD